MIDATSSFVPQLYYYCFSLVARREEMWKAGCWRAVAAVGGVVGGLKFFRAMMIGENQQLVTDKPVEFEE